MSSSKRSLHKMRKAVMHGENIMFIEESSSDSSAGNPINYITSYYLPQEHAKPRIKGLQRSSVSRSTVFTIEPPDIASNTSISSSLNRFRGDFETFKCKTRVFGESLNLCRCMAYDFRNRLEKMEKRLEGLEKRQKLFKVDTGSALACTTGDNHFVLRGIYSWESGCQTGNQLAAFFKFDLEWYEWAIGLAESARYNQYITTKITKNKIISQVSGTKGTYGTGIKGSYGVGVKGTTGVGIKGTVSSGATAVSGSGVGVIKGFGVQGQSGSGQYSQFGSGSSGSGLTGSVSSGTTTISGSGSGVIKGFGVQGQSGSGQYSQFGSGSVSSGSTGISGSGSGVIKGFGVQGQGQSGEYSQFGIGKFGSGSGEFGAEIKGPIQNTFSATYSEKKFFQSEPKYVTYTTKPEIVTFTTKPEYFTYTTKPKYVTYTTKPEIVTYTTKPEIISYTTKPEIITYTTKPEIITYTTKPKIVTYTTKPQIVRYDYLTSGSQTSQQVVAPSVSFNPSFSEVVGAKHTHDSKCKCLEGK